MRGCNAMKRNTNQMRRRNPTLRVAGWDDERTSYKGVGVGVDIAARPGKWAPGAHGSAASDGTPPPATFKVVYRFARFRLPLILCVGISVGAAVVART